MTSELISSLSENVTFEDYYLSTQVNWQRVDHGDTYFMLAWIKGIVPLGERKYSPLSDSQYVLDRKNGVIYRLADHWGDVASCKWPINEEERQSRLHFTIGKARISDFSRIK